MTLPGLPAPDPSPLYEKRRRKARARQKRRRALKAGRHTWQPGHGFMHGPGGAQDPTRGMAPTLPEAEAS